MSTTTKRKMTVNTLATLRKVIPLTQFQFLQTLLRGEEREFFVDAMTEIEFQYNDLPIIGSAGSDQPAATAIDYGQGFAIIKPLEHAAPKSTPCSWKLQSAWSLPPCWPDE